MCLLYFVGMFCGMLMHAKTQLSESVHSDVTKGMGASMTRPGLVATLPASFNLFFHPIRRPTKHQFLAES